LNEGVRGGGEERDVREGGDEMKGEVGAVGEKRGKGGGEQGMNWEREELRSERKEVCRMGRLARGG